MKLANFEGRRIEPTPGARGACPACAADLIARCGTQKVWHWAHKGRRHCDSWWENETAWHRDWKNRFPIAWQEIAARDERGELHIADVKTETGTVIEFQHSAIKPEEVEKRTKFYDKIVWVVDGTRRSTDLKQYELMLQENRSEIFDGVKIYTVWEAETRLLKEWGSIGRFVGFDFGGDTLCLLTAAQNNSRYLFDYPKDAFVDALTKGHPLPRVVFERPRTRGYRRRRF